MRIGIVGTGKMAAGFARGLVDAHEVWIGSRDAERGKQAASELGAAGGGAYGEAVRDAEVIIIGVPWTAVEETLPRLGDLEGTVVLDITNPYTADGLRPLEGTSTAEEIQKLIPKARVVKGFNHIFAANLTRPEIDGIAASVFIAGDDPEAKEVVFTIARDMGFDPVDVGDLRATRHLERLLQHFGGLGLNKDRVLRVLRRT